MLTGHRKVETGPALQEQLGTVIDSLQDVVVIAGGAVGADQLWAEAAIDRQVGFELYLPNWAYELNYHRQDALAVLRSSPFMQGERLVVHRPLVHDWRTSWRSERWWRDNFARNEAMVRDADVHVVCSHDRPNEYLHNTFRGGTAACVRTMAKLGVTEVLWVRASYPHGWDRVPLKREPPARRSLPAAGVGTRGSARMT